MKPVLLVIAGPNGAEQVEARLCVRTQDGALRKIYGELPAWVIDATRDRPLHGEFADLRDGG